MPKNVDSWDLFQKTQPAAAGSAILSGFHLPGRKADYITRGAGGEPIFLVRSRSDGPQRVPVRLRHLVVEYQIRCKVKDEDGRTEVGDFVRFACTAESPALFPLFVSGGEAILKTLPAAPKEAEIYRCVESFAELFSALARPSARSIKGLWAELLTIHLSDDCEGMLRSWHIDPSERFDFSNGSTHLEVKASESLQRNHEFSISQLRGVGRVFVVSILLQKSAGGPGVLDLAGQIEQKLNHSADLVPKLWTNIARCLGTDFDTGMDAQFDEEFSRASLRIVPAEKIPCVSFPLPTDVFDVRMKVSLDNVVRGNSMEWDDVQQKFKQG